MTSFTYLVTVQTMQMVQEDNSLKVEQDLGDSCWNYLIVRTKLHLTKVV